MKSTLTFILSLFTLISYSHEIRPAYLQFTENTDKSVDILWKQPILGEFSLPLHPKTTSNWMNDASASLSYTDTYLVKQWHIRNVHEALNGQTITIEGLEKTLTDVLVYITWNSGSTSSYLLKPSSPSVQLSQQQQNGAPVRSYLQLGIEHIWLGIDHLLFVLGLLLLVNNNKKLITTITTFTIAHSITLALATLKIITISSAFAEACIALSIVFLAVELAKHYRGYDGITYKYPWIVSFVFGLMHGLGFAGALANIGLPQQSISLALFLFNIGVEIGQLIFVFVVLLVIRVIHHLLQKRQQQLQWISVYIIGTMAAFWFLERVLTLFEIS